MSILNIRAATREGMRFLFSFYGLSETGKTYSALKIAAGIEPDPRKRMLLDTEGGKRGLAYVDDIDGGYQYAELTPPYTPERYIAAVEEIEAAGITVLVTDSISHAWFAEGGILDIVERSGGGNRDQRSKWIDPKRRLNRMMNRYRSSDMHHILCARAKQPLIDGPEENGRKTLVIGPVVPIQEKMMRFDMTVMALMLGRGTFTVEAPAGKCPGALLPIFGRSPLMDEEMGRSLAAWIGARAALPEMRALKTRATAAAELGAEPFREFWKGLNREERDIIKIDLGNYESIAKSADEERARDAADRDERQTDAHQRDADKTTLDDPFATKIGVGEAAPHDEANSAQETLPARNPWFDSPTLVLTPHTRNGKPDWLTWAAVQFLPRARQATTTIDLAHLLGDNENNLKQARFALTPDDAADLDAKIAEQWMRIPADG